METDPWGRGEISGETRVKGGLQASSLNNWGVDMSSKLNMLCWRWLRGILVRAVNRQSTGRTIIKSQDRDLLRSIHIIEYDET